MVDYANPITDIDSAERRNEVLRLSSFASGEVAELSTDTLITESGKLCLTTGAISSLRNVATNGGSVLWLPDDLEPEKDDTHPANVEKNLELYISESHYFVGHFVVPLLVTPSSDKGICLPEMLKEVEDINTIAHGFGLWLNTQHAEKDTTPKEDVIHKVGNIKINETAWEVSGPEGKPLDFTKKEVEVLIYLANNQNRACTRNEFLANIWDIHFAEPDNRSVDVFVRKIRKKLEEAGIEDFIETVNGVGYKVVTNKK
ncbi:MAG: winged helix-turn-helix domain-containing protein [Patescibacteria group bacterium]